MIFVFSQILLWFLSIRTAEILSYFQKPFINNKNLFWTKNNKILFVLLFGRNFSKNRCLEKFPKKVIHKKFAIFVL